MYFQFLQAANLNKSLPLSKYYTNPHGATKTKLIYLVFARSDRADFCFYDVTKLTVAVRVLVQVEAEGSRGRFGYFDQCGTFYGVDADHSSDRSAIKYSNKVLIIT